MIWCGLFARTRPYIPHLKNSNLRSDKDLVRIRPAIWNGGTSNRQVSTSSSVPAVESLQGKIDLDTFRRIAWAPQTPLLIRNYHKLPAIEKWFTQSFCGSVSFDPYMRSYRNVSLSYEFIPPLAGEDPSSAAASLQTLDEFKDWLQKKGNDDDDAAHVQHLLQTLVHAQGQEGIQSPPFYQFDAPMSLIMMACEFNNTRQSSAGRIKQLYVAQSNLSDLPNGLMGDLPVPDIVSRAGRGDIYDSSVWLGLQPTYTPLHRDPNPNIFYQMVSSKIVRLMRPETGSNVYARVQRELRSHGNSRFRGSEMMAGPERDLLHRAVWLDPRRSEDTLQATLEPKDALFIPKGWWHSVTSHGAGGELNASVNWWFR